MESFSMKERKESYLLTAASNQSVLVHAPTYSPNRPLYHNLPLEPQTHQVEMIGEFFFMRF